MTGQIVNLNRARWLALANAAVNAANTLDEGDALALGVAAAKMATATPPSTAATAMTGCLAFRWACLHWDKAPAAVRPALADALRAYAGEVRRLFEWRAPPREAASVAVPPPAQAALDLDDVPEPAWLRRADCGQ